MPISDTSNSPEQQLTIDFSVPELPVDDNTGDASNTSVGLKEEGYELLDYQLADLLEELNEKQNKTLRQSTLDISKKTREGHIAIACNGEGQAELLLTKMVGKAGDFKPLILDKGYLYLRRYWQYQQQLAEQINISILSSEQQSELTAEERNWQEEHLNLYFKKDIEDAISKDTEINWQKRAAEYALKNKFLVISGGPGTGKTTTITRILALLIEEYLYKKKNNKEKTCENRRGGIDSSFTILLAAPTGKASIRMLDSIRDAQQQMELDDEVQAYIPTQASTIHKLLGYIPDSITFKHNKNNTLKANIVLVDEASMIDIALMSKLIEAVPASAKFILIGDKDQLSSVETGSVFSDICKGLEGSKSLVTLHKNWRFSKESGIGQLAIAINKGASDKVITALDSSDSYSGIEAEINTNTNIKKECQLISPAVLNARQIPNELIQPWNKYFEIINNPTATLTEIFEVFNEYRILCALRKGQNGSINLSNRIETTLAKQGLINLRTGLQTGANWYHGRPIMITQNSYSKGLFNGDTGITLIKDGQVKVYFPDSENGNYKHFSPVRLPAHETTWAMTIHKSQGSEFNQVTLILPHDVMPLLTRQLIYTGVTRAKKQVSIVAPENVLIAGVKTEVEQATQIEKYLR